MKNTTVTMPLSEFRKMEIHINNLEEANANLSKINNYASFFVYMSIHSKYTDFGINEFIKASNKHDPRFPIPELTNIISSNKYNYPDNRIKPKTK